MMMKSRSRLLRLARRARAELPLVPHAIRVSVETRARRCLREVVPVPRSGKLSVGIDLRLRVRALSVSQDCTGVLKAIRPCERAQGLPGMRWRGL